MTKEEIGKILKSLRIKSNMTQAEVAAILGKKQQAIGHWETGYSQPDANTLFELCDIFETTIEDAFGVSKKDAYYSSIHKEIIRKYKELDNHGKQMVDFTLEKEWERSIRMHQLEDKNPIHLLNAAHERTDIEVTDEMRKHDDDIMDDDNF